jgi:hypothetical protein
MSNFAGCEDEGKKGCGVVVEASAGKKWRMEEELLGLAFSHLMGCCWAEWAISVLHYWVLILHPL